MKILLFHINFVTEWKDQNNNSAKYVLPRNVTWQQANNNEKKIQKLGLYLSYLHLSCTEVIDTL